MDQRAGTPGVALTAADWEVIERAAIGADLPGILRAHGWQSVRDEDAAHRRVLTDAEGSRRIVVSRDPIDQRWQWWDTVVMVVGTIVDAIIELLHFPSIHDVLVLLRRALVDPPEPLPVLEDVDWNEVADHPSNLPVSEHLYRSEEKHSEQPICTSEPDQAATDIIFEQPPDGSDDLVAYEAEVVYEEPPAEEDTTDVQDPEDIVPLPSRRRGRRR